MYDKVVHWFEVIGEVLARPHIRPENVYNMDETRVMLSILNLVKVLIKHDTQCYRGARVKRTIVLAIDYISSNGRCLKPIII